MERNIVNNYIGRRYARWLNYANYRCARTEMAGEGADVLNEVLLALLEKPLYRMERLLDTPQGSLRALDLYVLKMIRRNTSSATSPYRCRYPGCPAHMRVNPYRIELADEVEEVPDRAAEILERFRLVRTAFEEMKMSAFARKVFEYRFILDEPFASWPGTENRKCLYKTYNRVKKRIRKKLCGSPADKRPGPGCRAE